MRVLFFFWYSRDQASSRVRGFYIAEVLREKGVHCDILYGYSRRTYNEFITKLPKYDIIYFQKRYSKIDIKLNKFARLLGKKTIFDLDDAPGGRKLGVDGENRAIEMIMLSSVTIVGSHKLANFARHFSNRVYIIPTPINLRYYKPKRKTGERDYITLGWIGNGIDYKKDIQILIRPLEKIGKRYDIKLNIIGALGQAEIYQSFSKMKEVIVEIIDSINWADPLAVPLAISNFDVGLYPLLNNRYNQYKCGFKALEYMAMEVPVIASPVGENVFIIENEKDGFLASNEKEWEERLSYLIENYNIRKKIGKRGRRKIEKNYSTEVYANKLIKIFEKLNL